MAIEKSLWMLAVVGVSLALAGCGAPSTQASGGSPSAPSPLDKYAAVWSGSETSEEESDAQNRKIEELTAQCMADEGFTYVPQVAENGTDDAAAAAMDEVDWDSLEFAEKYGYGFVDWPGKEEAEDFSGEVQEDPNAKYVQSLGPSDQVAYQETLYGKLDITPEDINEGNIPEYDWAAAGCSGFAYHEVYGAEDAADAAQQEDPEYLDLVDSMNALYAAINTGTNPDVAALDDEWVACMKGSGFTGLTGKYRAQETLYEEYSAISADPGEEPSSPDVLAAFQSREIHQAVADWKCAEEVNYRQRSQNITLAAEKQFVAENKNRLESLLLRYSGQSS